MNFKLNLLPNILIRDNHINKRDIKENYLQKTKNITPRNNLYDPTNLYDFSSHLKCSTDRIHSSLKEMKGNSIAKLDYENLEHLMCVTSLGITQGAVTFDDSRGEPKSQMSLSRPPTLEAELKMKNRNASLKNLQPKTEQEQLSFTRRKTEKHLSMQPKEDPQTKELFQIKDASKPQPPQSKIPSKEERKGSISRKLMLTNNKKFKQSNAKENEHNAPIEGVGPHLDLDLDLDLISCKSSRARVESLPQIESKSCTNAQFKSGSIARLNTLQSFSFFPPTKNTKIIKKYKNGDVLKIKKPSSSDFEKKNNKNLEESLCASNDKIDSQMNNITQNKGRSITTLAYPRLAFESIKEYPSKMEYTFESQENTNNENSLNISGRENYLNNDIQKADCIYRRNVDKTKSFRQFHKRAFTNPDLSCRKITLLNNLGNTCLPMHAEEPQGLKVFNFCEEFFTKPSKIYQVHNIAGCLASPQKKREKSQKRERSLNLQSKTSKSNQAHIVASLADLEKDFGQKQNSQAQVSSELILDSQAPLSGGNCYDFVQSCDLEKEKDLFNINDVNLDGKVFAKKFDFKNKKVSVKQTNRSLKRLDTSISEEISERLTEKSYKFLQEFDQILKDDVRTIDSLILSSEQTPKQTASSRFESIKNDLTGKRTYNESLEGESEDLLDSTRSGRTPRNFGGEESQSSSFQQKTLGASPRNYQSPKLKSNLLHTFSFKHGFMTINVKPPIEEIQDSLQVYPDSLISKANSEDIVDVEKTKSLSLSQEPSQQNERFSNTFEINSNRRLIKNSNNLFEELGSKYIQCQLHFNEEKLKNIDSEIMFKTMDLSLKSYTDYNFCLSIKRIVESCMNKNVLREFCETYALKEEARTFGQIKSMAKLFPIGFSINQKIFNENVTSEEYNFIKSQEKTNGQGEFTDDLKELQHPIDDITFLKFNTGELGQITQKLFEFKDRRSFKVIMNRVDLRLLIQPKKELMLPLKSFLEGDSKANELVERYKNMLAIINKASQKNWDELAKLFYIAHKNILFGSFDFMMEYESNNIPQNLRINITNEQPKILQNNKIKQPLEKTLDNSFAESKKVYINLDEVNKSKELRKPHVCQSGVENPKKSLIKKETKQRTLLEKKPTILSIEDVGGRKTEEVRTPAFTREARARNLRKIPQVNPSESLSSDSKSDQSNHEKTQQLVSNAEQFVFAKKASISTNMLRSESQTETLPDFLPLSKLRTLISEDTFEGVIQLQVPSQTRLESLSKLSTICSRRNEENTSKIHRPNSPPKIKSHTSLSPRAYSPSLNTNDEKPKESSQRLGFKERVIELNYQGLKRQSTNPNETYLKPEKGNETRRNRNDYTFLNCNETEKETNAQPAANNSKISNKIIFSQLQKKTSSIRPTKDLKGTLKDELIKAIYFNKLHEVQQMLYRCPRGTYEMKDDDQNTLLMIAAKCGYKEILKEFIGHGVDINAQNVEGNTALHLSLSYQHFDIADILIKNGAKQHIRNSRGQTPWEAAGN